MGRKKTQRVSLLDMGPEEVRSELEDRLRSWDIKPFRAKQIIRQIYFRGLLDFGRMTDLPLDLREKLAGTYDISPLTAADKAVSRDGTVKVLWRLEDGEQVESVAIPMERGHSTVCLSTQTGCPLKCSFCATGRLGHGRNLSPGEILAQALTTLETAGMKPEEAVDDDDTPPAPNFVFMGMGEPFLNYDNLSAALRVMNHNDCMQVGARRITVSTVGLPNEIVRFGSDFPQMKLAISLHAARDGLRKTIMPVAGRVTQERLIEACKEYYRLSNRRLTFEYLVLPGVNDLPEDVEALGRVTDQIPCKINLIGFNPVEGIPFRPPTVEQMERFRKALLARCKVAVTRRDSHGEDIQGACGQLAAGRNG